MFQRIIARIICVFSITGINSVVPINTLGNRASFKD
jgi:hypothetical protein